MPTHPPTPPPEVAAPDSPGVHVVIKGVLHGVGTEYYKDISGCAIGQHAKGLLQKERPHYHIWLPNTYTVTALKATLRSYYDSKLPDLKWNTHANSYYTVKEHNSFRKWKEYVFNPELADCKQPTVEVWNVPDQRPIDYTALVYTGEATNDVTYIVAEVPKVEKARKKSESISSMFLKHMISLELAKPVQRSAVVRCFNEWKKGDNELHRSSAPVRHAYLMLNDMDERILRAMDRELQHRAFPAEYYSDL